ncbi:MAG: hypothetical protein AB7I19_13910 [Planctomycetota bacterium]
MIDCRVSKRRRTVVAALLVAGLSAGITGCAAAPRFSTELAAATALLDAQDYEQAVPRLAVAHSVAQREYDRVLTLAMTLEAALALANDELARESVDRMRALAPAAFLTWKATAILELRYTGIERARAATNAALGRAEFEPQRLWVRDFNALLDALVALREGDLRGARRLIDTIETGDVRLPAAWLRGRLDAIEGATQQREAAASGAGVRVGLLDLWHAAGGDPELQARVQHRARQIRVDLALLPSEQDVQRRAELVPSPLALAGLAAVARLLSEQVPHQLRS